MGKVKLKIKWMRQTLDIKADVKAEDALDTLKAQIMTLTQVPVDRQKLMIKGKILTDDNIGTLKKGSKLLMTGTAVTLAEAPKTKIKFVEDMTKAELAKFAPDTTLSAGLNNLGNTCFMNSTLQCFRGIKEFKQGLKDFSSVPAPASERNMQRVLCEAWGRLYTQMDATQEPVTPFMFTESMRTLFPALGTRDQKGNFQQQDADECLTNILSAATRVVKLPGQQESLTHNLFNGRFSVEMKKVGAETGTKSVAEFQKLQCFIDAKINYMNEGIQKGLVEELERKDSNGVPSVFTRTSKIAVLPKILVVQFVRFFYNRTKQSKSKILRKVTFPEIFDVIEFCDAEKKASLLAARKRLAFEEDLKLGIARKKKKAKKEDAKDDTKDDDAMDTEETVEVKEAPLPTDSSGNYELMAVVTHQGRSADSGHYIGWARKKEKSDEWWKFDDHVVTECKTEDIKKLSGGGDWHTNYISFYRRIDNLENKVWVDMPATPAKKVAE